MTADEIVGLVAVALVVIVAVLAELRARMLERERESFYRWLGTHTVHEIDDWRRDK